jgi:hypothetical protein
MDVMDEPKRERSGGRGVEQGPGLAVKRRLVEKEKEKASKSR